eukprot:CAMPEP_0194220390 /NCGR_PEP_ID=MMETSP0156-20130528/28251_1 /TAXON_ID=33649 /ORGANISM="Thalassionema nitzschioides, Strain L26-B" /LENGTH=510 /DNA_ID=CAMNT_0038950403 /DNA_START=156 /DNA_END=1691 /DNA_ORIENTATION=+
MKLSTLAKLRNLRPQLCRTLISVNKYGCRVIDPKPELFAMKKPLLCGGYRLKSSLPISDVEDNNLSSLSGNEKLTPFLLADIGEGIAEVEVLQWFVSPGDRVHQFDRICEVQSDKATVEITSRYDGVVDSLSDKSDIIKVGSPLIHLYVENDEEDCDSNQIEVAPKESSAQEEKIVQDTFNTSTVPRSPPTFSDARPPPKILATPAVRKLCMDYNLDPSKIDGSGPKGRVLKADVLQILFDSGRLKDGNDSGSLNEGDLSVSEEAQHIQTSSSPSVPEISQHDEVVTIRGYNRIMVKSMTESLSIPHMCYSDEVNMNAFLKIRKTLTETKLSILPFAIKAASLSIKEYQILNSTFDVDDMAITYHSNHNIGIAMDTPKGLAVPVIKNCQNLSVLEIGNELKRLKELATAGTLDKDDISGATFSLSNIGAIGGTYMSPIVSRPQVAIGAIGKIQRLPRFISAESLTVEEAHIMQISWSADHRVIDGATLARFSNRWKELIENPTLMMFLLK